MSFSMQDPRLWWYNRCLGCFLSLEGHDYRNLQCDRVIEGKDNLRGASEFRWSRRLRCRCKMRLNLLGRTGKRMMISAKCRRSESGKCQRRLRRLRGAIFGVLVYGKR